MPNHTIEDVINQQFGDLDRRYRRSSRDLRKVMNRLPPEELNASLVTLDGDSWTRTAGEFSNDRIYHTDITPPSDASVMYISPVSASGRSLSAITIDKDVWDQLADADGDNTSIRFNDTNYIGRIFDTGLDGHIDRVRYSSYYFMIGKTSPGQLAVGLALESDNIGGGADPGLQDNQPEIEGVRVLGSYSNKC